jgi:hypothetical protein
VRSWWELAGEEQSVFSNQLQLSPEQQLANNSWQLAQLKPTDAEQAKGQELKTEIKNQSLERNCGSRRVPYARNQKQRRHNRVPSLRSGQKTKISRRTCPRLNLSFHF